MAYVLSDFATVLRHNTQSVPTCVECHSSGLYIVLRLVSYFSLIITSTKQKIYTYTFPLVTQKWRTLA